jgi:hypothetical protein
MVKLVTFAKKGLNIVNQNAGEAMRYAPLVTNMLQGRNLKVQKVFNTLHRK